MKRLITLSGAVLCLMLSATFARAQQNGLSRGEFKTEVKPGIMADATYSVDVQHAGDLVFMVMAKTTPFTINARIVNAKGVEQISIGTKEVNMRSFNKIDVSKLAKGNYFVEVFTGSDKKASAKIAFTL